MPGAAGLHSRALASEASASSNLKSRRLSLCLRGLLRGQSRQGFCRLSQQRVRSRQRQVTGRGARGSADLVLACEHELACLLRLQTRQCLAERRAHRRQVEVGGILGDHRLDQAARLSYPAVHQQGLRQDQASRQKLVATIECTRVVGIQREHPSVQRERLGLLACRGGLGQQRGNVAGGRAQVAQARLQRLQLHARRRQRFGQRKALGAPASGAARPAPSAHARDRGFAYLKQALRAHASGPDRWPAPTRTARARRCRPPRSSRPDAQRGLRQFQLPVHARIRHQPLARPSSRPTTKANTSTRRRDQPAQRVAAQAAQPSRRASCTPGTASSLASSWLSWSKSLTASVKRTSARPRAASSCEVTAEDVHLRLRDHVGQVLEQPLAVVGANLDADFVARCWRPGPSSPAARAPVARRSGAARWRSCGDGC